MLNDLSVLQSLRLPNGLVLAAAHDDYAKVWIRDNAYVALAYLEAGHTDGARAIVKGLSDIFQRYERILTLDRYPQNDTEILHPRFMPDGGLVPGGWSNKQHDAIGVFLFTVGQLTALDPASVDAEQRRICQLLVTYLEHCRYWEDPDNGMWEISTALHASSLGACIKGLEAVASFCTYDAANLAKAKANLERLLPRESDEHETDLAQLSLLWPYGYDRRDILEHIERSLLKQSGVVRFAGDVYEAQNGAEPQWVLGMAWLGIVHAELGNTARAQDYLKRTEALYTDAGLPESYLAPGVPCPHMPLAWSHAMAIVLRAKLAPKP